MIYKCEVCGVEDLCDSPRKKICFACKQIKKTARAEKYKLKKKHAKPRT